MEGLLLGINTLYMYYLSAVDVPRGLPQLLASCVHHQVMRNIVQRVYFAGGRGFTNFGEFV